MIWLTTGVFECCILEAQGFDIQCPNKGIQETNRIIRTDVVVQCFWKQGQLITV